MQPWIPTLKTVILTFPGFRLVACSYVLLFSHYLLQVRHWTFMRYSRKQMEISTDNMNLCLYSLIFVYFFNHVTSTPGLCPVFLQCGRHALPSHCYPVVRTHPTMAMLLHTHTHTHISAHLPKKYNDVACQATQRLLFQNSRLYNKLTHVCVFFCSKSNAEMAAWVGS